MARKPKAIDWAKKRLRSDKGQKVPAKLKSLVSRSAKQRSEALQWFSREIFEDGPYMSVGADLVPVLVDLLEQAPKYTNELGVLLVDLAVCEHTEHLETGVDVKAFRGALKKAYERFAQGEKVYVQLLESRQADARKVGAFALAFIREKGKEAHSLLSSRLGVEKDPNVLASLLLGVGLAGLHGKPKASAAESFLEHEHPVVRAAAAISTALLEAKPAPKTTQALVEALTVGDADLPWLYGHLAFHAFRVLRGSAKERGASLVSPLRKALEDPGALSDEARKLLVEAVVVTAFGAFKGRRADPVTHAELDADQQQLARLIRDLGISSSYFEDYGLPSKASGFELLLPDAAGPLVRVLDVTISKKKRGVPVWKCLHLVLEGMMSPEALATALTGQVPREHLFALLVEASRYRHRVPVIPTEVVVGCLEWLGQDAVAPARELAQELVSDPAPRSSLAFLALAALVRNGEVPLPAAYLELGRAYRYVLNAIGYDEVLQAFPEDVRSELPEPPKRR
ncbi:MAG: hypothetical protein JXR96_26155 [Deltaproteobacteria bacterium]|nr:hypothetical protein [Deltaproteobacteria bacterium]